MHTQMPPIPPIPFPFKIFLFFLHFPLSSAHPPDRPFPCPLRCSCAHSAVICKGLGLLAIPKGIPPDTTRLDLQENRIQRIGIDDFEGLAELRVLHLGDNLIENIDAGAFGPLRRLERLRLGRNRLRTIPDGLFAGNPFLKRLDLSENNLWSLSTEQLAGPEQLVALQLDHNQLQCLDSLALNRWHSLESISLSSNALTSIAELDLASLPNLRTLRLVDNPWHCDCRLRWLKRLKVASQIRCHRPALLLGRSLDSINLKQLKCSGLEKREGRRACREVDLCPPGCGCTESGPGQMVVDCHDRQLRQMPQRLPPNTVELRLDQNRISRLENRSFWNLPRLARLDLSKNSISQIHSEAFAGLGQLNSLMLFANNLTDLPPNIFRGLSSLQVLLLNGNHLKCLRDGTFEGLSQLRLLSLYDNRIQSISESTFAPLANSLQTLHLARNPLICDCNFQWIARLLAARPIETSGARCHSPRRMARKRIAILAAERFRCIGSERLVTEGAGECRLDWECPEPCRCEGTIVDCSGRQLTAPPPAIPRFATALLLANNQIVHFPPSFGHLPNLQFLNLSSNRLISLPPDSLAGLPSLLHLDLRNNSLPRFDPRSLVPNISLQSLLLDHNPLRCLSLGQLPSLRHLSLRFNPQLISLGPIGPKLDRLDLDQKGGQWLCDCQLRPLLRMKGRNWTNEGEEGPKCAEPAKLRGKALANLGEKEMECRADHLLGQCTEAGEFCPRGCECSTGNSPSSPSPPTIVRCSNRSLLQIPWGIPPDTAELLLDNNRIGRIETEQFKGLSKLVKLDLSHNLLEHIPPRAFAPLPSLAALILAHNQIRCLADSSFQGLPSLRLLSLHANRLSQLPESAFGPSLLANLSHIALGVNPLWCDCQMNWASRWVRSKFVEPGIARCEGPPSRRLQLLLSVEPFGPCPSAPPPTPILAKCLPCLANPCTNSAAACFPLPHGQFRCQCPPGFHGQFCEHRVDACFGQPCQNGGECRPANEEEGRFGCKCAAGFGGERCEREMDECVEGGGREMCLNGGKCRDEVGGFRCECAPKWRGELCEQLEEEWICPLEEYGADNSSLEFPRANCSLLIESKLPEAIEEKEKALVRAERAHTETPFPTKKCEFNFGGPNCSQRRAIGLNRSDAFLPLGEWGANGQNGQRAVDLSFKTVQRDGILLWLGPPSNASSFLLLELVQGRLRSALQLGPAHSPPSQLFSPIPVNDGLPHSLSLRLSGQRLSLHLDSLPLQFVLNSGPRPSFPSDPFSLFLGGIPVDLGRRSLVQFRISDSSSIRGCFWDIRLDNSTNFLDLAIFIPQNDSTAFVDCEEKENEGKRRKLRGRKCTKGRQGRGEKWTEPGGKCRSTHPISGCIGQCAKGQCCAPKARRIRRIQLECLDGTKKWEMAEMPRNCGCKEEEGGDEMKEFG